MAEFVRMTDVSPRDGLQNEAGIIPTHQKIGLVKLLLASGVEEVEVTSFVSPKWIPQLSDAEDVLAAVAGEPQLRDRSVLVPNEQGMLRALAVNKNSRLDSMARGVITKVSVFTAASETFCRKNINASIAESIERFRPVVALATEHNLVVRGYVSCAFRCPFEGWIAPERVAEVSKRLCDIGVWEIDLGDTIGAASHEDVAPLISAVAPALAFGYHTNTIPSRMVDVEYRPLTLHLHDTFGRAAECVKAALDCGIRSFDGSVAGLGGCPYASTPEKRAPGNIATELLVRTIHDAGYQTGVDLDALAKAADYAREIVAESRRRAASTNPEAKS